MKKTLSLALCSLSLVVLLSACQPANAPSNDEAPSTGTSQEISSKLVPFTPAAFAAVKGTQPVAIHFTAKWCSTCKALNRKLDERAAELPENAIIFLADYDTEDELKAEYGITVQTTVVFFDKAGNKIDTIHNPTFDRVNELLST